jgi:hypothetical protein
MCQILPLLGVVGYPITVVRDTNGHVDPWSCTIAKIHFGAFLSQTEMFNGNDYNRVIFNDDSVDGVLPFQFDKLWLALRSTKVFKAHAAVVLRQTANSIPADEVALHMAAIKWLLTNKRTTQADELFNNLVDGLKHYKTWFPYSMMENKTADEFRKAIIASDVSNASQLIGLLLSHPEAVTDELFTVVWEVYCYGKLRHLDINDFVDVTAEQPPMFEAYDAKNVTAEYKELPVVDSAMFDRLCELHGWKILYRSNAIRMGLVSNNNTDRLNWCGRVDAKILRSVTSARYAEMVRVQKTTENNHMTNTLYKRMLRCPTDKFGEYLNMERISFEYKKKARNETFKMSKSMGAYKKLLSELTGEKLLMLATGRTDLNTVVWEGTGVVTIGKDNLYRLGKFKRMYLAICEEYGSRYRLNEKDNRHGHGNDKKSYHVLGGRPLGTFTLKTYFKTCTDDEIAEYMEIHKYCCGVEQYRDEHGL